MVSERLLVGAAKVDITPPLHVPYLGFDPRQGTFEGVHDRLHARAAVFENAEMAAAVLSADALGLSRDLLGPGSDFIEEVRRCASDRTGVSPDAILLAATHAHSTPETYGITRIWERDDCGAWVETLADQLASVIALAWRDRAPATLRLGAAELPGMSRNRREHLGGPDAYHPVDESLTVLLAERDEAAPVLLVNFTCHPVTVQVNPLVSADFPGRGMETVEQTLGAGSCCLFLQGAAGDINPIHGHTGEWRDVETYGLMLAGGTLEALGAARLGEPMLDTALGAARETLSVAAREAPSLPEAEQSLNGAEAALAETPKDDPEHQARSGAARAARETCRLAQFGTDPIQAEVQVLRIGGLAIAALPGELFCELGLRLKQDCSRPLMVAECANGCLGYLHPESAWDEGGYEVGLGAWCRVARGGPEKLVAAAARLAKSLQS